MERVDCDVLVVGGGAAGSRAAYEAKKIHAGLKVLLVVAGGFGSSGSTNLVASESLGINAPFDYMRDGDNPNVYYQDMIETGGGLSDPKLCRIIADESCERVKELIDLGLRFDEEGGHPIQRKLSGCTKARSLTCGGSTGQEMVRVFKAALLKLGVEVLEHIRVLDLLQDEGGRVCGVTAILNGRVLSICARSVVLATGGAGRIFRHHVNPPSLEGDGWCMAYRAGARLVNMEFFQMGPAVFKPRLKFIIHSHLWRLRPRLTNRLGENFLSAYCPKDVRPDDVVSLKAMSYPFSVRTAAKYLDIAIFKEMRSGRGTSTGGVYFDVTHVGREKLEERAPVIYRTLKQAGVDLASEKIEIGMVIQNFNGGILIDGNGSTGIAGLYAAGEVTGGVHGADRPGGNNLIDTQVFGFRSGRAAAEYAFAVDRSPVRSNPANIFETDPCSSEDEALLASCADLYYSNLTVVRTKAGLEEVLRFVEANRGRRNLFVSNRLSLGAMIATAAITREESRGTHSREDFPLTDPAWTKRIILVSGREGNPAAQIAP